MMLDMIGHVPRQHPHQRRGKGGAGVFEHVGHPRAIAMLGQKVKPQHRLAQQDRHQPQPDQRRAGQQRQRRHAIAQPHPARLAHHPAARPRRDIVRHPPPQHQPPQQPHLRSPIGQARHMPQPLPPCLGLAALQFRVLAPRCWSSGDGPDGNSETIQRAATAPARTTRPTPSFNRSEAKGVLCVASCSSVNRKTRNTPCSGKTSGQSGKASAIHTPRRSDQRPVPGQMDQPGRGPTARTTRTFSAVQSRHKVPVIHPATFPNFR